MASSPRAPTRVEIKVLSTLALMKAMRELVSRHEQLTGTIVTTDFAPTNALENRIRSREAADVAILTAEAIDQLTGEGVLALGAGSILPSAVGLAVRAGAPRPEIGSVEALKSALLKAESIAYSKIGASGVFFADLIQRLGIAEDVNAKARIIPSGFTAELVASGEAELAVQQMSELMMVPGIEVVARLPSEIQSVTTFSAGLFTGSAHREASMRVVESCRLATALRSSEHQGSILWHAIELRRWRSPRRNPSAPIGEAGSTARSGTGSPISPDASVIRLCDPADWS